MPGFTLINTMAGTLQANTTTAKSQTRVIANATTARRVRVEELEWSAASVPNATDCQIQVDFTYCGATGAGGPTAATLQPNDSGLAIGSPVDVASSTGGVNYTSEPTTFIQANTWYARGFNQRSGVIWQTQPGREIIMPAAVSVGGVMRSLSTNYTGFVIAREVVDEL